MPVDSDRGPGTYEPKPLAASKLTTIGVRRSERIETNPGPGQYNPVDTLTKPKRESVDFKKLSPRSSVLIDSQLGPGSYDPKELKTERSVNIGKSSQASLERTTPGPGYYDVNLSQTQYKVPSATIPRSLRHTSSQQDLQGPAHLECDMTECKTYTI